MSEYIQEARLISIHVDGQGPHDLLLGSFTGTEVISRPFFFEAEVLSEHPAVDFKAIIGQRVRISIQTNEEEQSRFFHGYVSRFAQSGSDNMLHHYHLEMVPWIWFLTRHADCRIFHNMSIPQIVQKVIEDFKGTPKCKLKMNLQPDDYPKLEYTVQYRETSLNFISRLMEHAGIYYYFEHTKDDHFLVIANNSDSAMPCPIQSHASHIVRNTGEMDEDHIISMFSRREFRTGIYSSTDYNFKTPDANLKTSENTVIVVGGNQPLEMFDYPGLYRTQDEGARISKIRMEEHEAAHHSISGSGLMRSFVPGYTFTLKDHFRSDLNVEYLLTEVHHSATAGMYETGGGGGFTYTNQFSCIPKSVRYRPPRITPKPYIQGVQTAIVIGKSDDSDDTTSSDDGATGDGEEIWVDKYGRIIVRFPWDRAGACSCRARVAQQWAGVKWGGMVIPRVGQEVLVSFLDGDPDRPIVIGCVYNGTHKVPYDLPEYQTRSTFKTRSSTGGGDDNYNELRFEDKTGGEQIFLRGEMDYDTRIKNDAREWIGNNQSIIIKKNRMEKVEGDESIQITGKRAEKVEGDDNLNVTGNLNVKAAQNVSIQAGQNIYEKSGQNFAHEAGMAIHLKAGMTMVLEAGVQLSLKAGSSFIDIGPEGIAISGTPMVMINSGGSAASGSGSSPTDPADPQDPDEADDGSKGTKM